MFDVNELIKYLEWNIEHSKLNNKNWEVKIYEEILEKIENDWFKNNEKYLKNKIKICELEQRKCNDKEKDLDDGSEEILYPCSHCENLAEQIFAYKELLKWK